MSVCVCMRARANKTCNKIQRICCTLFPLKGGLKALYNDNKYEGGNGMTDLQVMRMCAMRDDENVNTAVVGFSWIQTRS